MSQVTEPTAIPYSGDYVSEDQNNIRTLTNPTGKKFTFHWGGKPYSVGAGETRAFPEFIALHGAKHLAEELLVQKGKEKEVNSLRYAVMGKLIDREDVEALTSKQDDSVEEEEVEQPVEVQTELSEEDVKELGL